MTVSSNWSVEERGGAHWGTAEQVVYFVLFLICNGDRSVRDIFEVR